jgi:hypothetical protein
MINKKYKQPRKNTTVDVLDLKTKITQINKI